MKKALKVGSEIITKKVKMPIRAGMEYRGGKVLNYKVRIIGYSVWLHTYQVDIYSDGHRDEMQIGGKEIKRVIK